MGVHRILPYEVVNPDKASELFVTGSNNRCIFSDLSRGDSVLIIRLNVLEALKKKDAVANPSTAAVRLIIFSIAGSLILSNFVLSTNGWK